MIHSACFLSLTTGLIQSRLDYCNSVLYGSSASNFHKLQMVQDALARTIAHSSLSVPSSQLLSDLHWLPIHKRVNFKIATFLSTRKPTYLDHLIYYQQLSLVLLSSGQLLLLFFMLRVWMLCLLFCRPTNLERYISHH